MHPRADSSSHAPARWAIVALPIVAGAVLLTWWIGNDSSRLERAALGRRPGGIEANVSDRSGQADLFEAVPAAQRVEATRQPCPGELPSTPNLHVRIVDQAGVAVPDALIVRWDMHGWEQLERSDAEGMLVTTIPQCTGQSVSVCADGFAVAIRDLGDRFPVEIVVGLNPERSLSGRVADMRGAPLPGMTVVAWPSHRPPSAKEVIHSAAAPAMLPRATTDGEGRFVLRGLDPSATHTLVAGGRGYVLVDPILLGSNSDEEVELRLWRLHGLHLVVRSLGGGPLSLPEDLGTTGCTYFGHSRDRLYRHIDPESPQAVLTAALRDRAVRGPGYTLHETLLLYASPGDSDRVGPIHYSFCAPGYAPATGELWVPSLAGEGMAEESWTLEQVVPVFCPLEVRVHGIPGQQLAPIHTAWGRPLFVFARNVEADCEYFFPLPDSSSTTLDGLLPAGTTEFVLGTTEWQNPDWTNVLFRLDLTEQGDVLDVDLSGFGGVELELFDSMGGTVRGPVQIELRDGKGTILRHLEFHRAPYRAYGLGQGEYSVTVHRPYSPWDDSAHSNVFQIEPGGFVKVVCVPGEVKGR